MMKKDVVIAIYIHSDFLMTNQRIVVFHAYYAWLPV